MTTEQKIIKNKVALLELARQLGNVSQACKILQPVRDGQTVPRNTSGPVASHEYVVAI
jgi:ribosomal protein S28E/S33